MDRSFLSNASVVAASRDFVCIRLATYEDQKEADFMKSIYIGRSGDLENTTFGILSHDGKRQLARSGRGPFHAYRNGASMAAGMKRIAAQYLVDQHSGAKKTVAQKDVGTDQQLPLMKDLELALNVASADGLPLIVTVAPGKDQLDSLNKRLTGLAWNAKLAGQFIYASVMDEKELKPITGVTDGHQILVVEPGQFGLSGKVVRQFALKESLETIQSELHDVIVNFPRRQKDHDSHIRLGIQLGIKWQSEIPETDQQSLRAKERVRRGR
jgi:hypothetical protein